MVFRTERPSCTQVRDQGRLRVSLKVVEVETWLLWYGHSSNPSLDEYSQLPTGGCERWRGSAYRLLLTRVASRAWNPPSVRSSDRGHRRAHRNRWREVLMGVVRRDIVHIPASVGQCGDRHASGRLVYPEAAQSVRRQARTMEVGRPWDCTGSFRGVGCSLQEDDNEMSRPRGDEPKIGELSLADERMYQSSCRGTIRNARDRRCEI